MTPFILSQILIGIAFLFDLASFQFKKREITLSFFAAAALLIAVHFFLLGHVTAGLIAGLSALRFLVSIFTTHQYVMYVFLLLMGGVAISTFDGIEDLFILSMGVLSTIGAFQKDEKRLRHFMMPASLSIITHNILIWSPAAILLETFFLLSNLVSYYRFYIRGKKQEVVEQVSQI